MRVQLGGFDQGVAARAGGDVARAGERGDPVGLGLAFALVVDAARRSVVGSPIGLDGCSVGGEGLGVGAAAGVRGGQQFEVAPGIERNSAPACGQAGGLQQVARIGGEVGAAGDEVVACHDVELGLS